MVDFRKTRRTDVQAKLNGRSLPVSGLILSHELGTLPTAMLQTAVDNQGKNPRASVKIDLQKIGQLNRLLQDKFTNHFSTDPDLQILVGDGDGGQVDFKCYSGRPSTSLAFGNLQISLTGVHQRAALNLFNPIIYRSNSYYTKPSQTLREEIKTTDSLARRLRLFLEPMMERYQEAATNKTMPWEFQSSPVAAMNQIAWESVRQFLVDSENSTRLVGLTSAGFNNENLNKTLLDFLGSTPNMMGVVGRMQPEFFLQLNANWSMAWLETLRNLEDPGDRVIKAPVNEFSFNLAPQFEPPLVQVLVTGMGSRYHLVPGNNTDAIKAAVGSDAPEVMLQKMQDAAEFTAGLTQQRLANDYYAFNSLLSLARYPDNVPSNAAGRYEIVSAPAWVYSYDFTKGNDNIGKAFTHRPVAAEQNFRDADTRLISVARHELNQCLAEATSGRVTENLLEWVAKQTFESLYLASAQARVVLPLTLKVQVGRTYRMCSVNGEELFTAFLNGATHHMTIGSGGEEGAAYTTLSFSHVRAPGFALDPRVTDPLLISTGPDRPVQFTTQGQAAFDNLDD